VTGEAVATAPPAAGPSSAAGVQAPDLVVTDITRVQPGLVRWLHSFPPLRLPRFGGWRLRMPRRGTLLRPWMLVPVLLAVLRSLLRFGAHGALHLLRLAQRILLRQFDWARDQIRATVLDTMDRLRKQPDPILRLEAGEDPCLALRSVALFVHFSPDGRLSEMVRRQLGIYRRLGFATILISNSPSFPEDAWQEARRFSALVVHRRNRGLDFGGWKDLMPVALDRWPEAEEVLVVNDSVLGPIRPLDPVIAAMRQAGPGFFGLLESVQGGPHLQSWFTLARGPKAIADLADFLRKLRLSRSKWRIIQRGELRMARQMQRAGNRVAAVYGYERLVDMALADPGQRAYLDRAIPLWVRGVDRAAARRMLMVRPVNPAHHLWWALNGPAGCPFIKTELVRRNPGRLPGIDAWPDLVTDGAPCPPEVIRAHLAALGP